MQGRIIPKPDYILCWTTNVSKYTNLLVFDTASWSTALVFLPRSTRFPNLAKNSVIHGSYVLITT